MKSRKKHFFLRIANRRYNYSTGTQLGANGPFSGTLEPSLANARQLIPVVTDYGTRHNIWFRWQFFLRASYTVQNFHLAIIAPSAVVKQLRTAGTGQIAMPTKTSELLIIFRSCTREENEHFHVFLVCKYLCGRQDLFFPRNPPITGKKALALSQHQHWYSRFNWTAEGPSTREDSFPENSTSKSTLFKLNLFPLRDGRTNPFAPTLIETHTSKALQKEQHTQALFTHVHQCV